MKPITKQLIKVVFILSIVTVVSLGIRQFRLETHRYGTVENPVVAKTELNSDTDLLHKINYKAGQQYTDSTEPDKKIPIEDSSEAKPFKEDYAKTKGKKDIEKISLGENEYLAVSGEGEIWHVSKQPDGTVVKMQIQIDENTGRMNVINIYGGKSQSSQDIERISMSDNEDLYISGEGDLWYVSRQADGSTTKRQALIDDTTGEMILIDPDELNK